MLAPQDQLQNQAPDIDSFLPPKWAGAYVLLFAAGLIAPFILIPIISITHYSEVVEELTKLVAVLFCLVTLNTFKSQLWGVILFAAMFGISETVLYSPSLFQTGDSGALLLGRLVLTIPMHILTAVIIFLPGSVRKYYLVFGLALAIAIHLAFNAFVPNLTI